MCGIVQYFVECWRPQGYLVLNSCETGEAEMEGCEVERTKGWPQEGKESAFLLPPEVFNQGNQTRLLINTGLVY